MLYIIKLTMITVLAITMFSCKSSKKMVENKDIVREVPLVEKFSQPLEMRAAIFACECNGSIGGFPRGICDNETLGGGLRKTNLNGRMAVCGYFSCCVRCNCVFDFFNGMESGKSKSGRSGEK